MQFDDKSVNGQPVNGRPPSIFDLAQAPPLPLPDSDHAPRPARLARLRAAWDASWEEGGFLYQRWEDVRHARAVGWHGMANWLKTALILGAGSLLVLLFNAAVDVVLQAAHHLLTAALRVQVGTDTSTGVWAVIDNPVRTYIAQHSAGLPISASTVYTLWQFAGLIGLVGGFLRSTGARLVWTGWGAATIAAVWTAAPDGGRTIATGVAVLLWSLASVVALRGLSLRPTAFIHVHNTIPQARPAIRPQSHISAQPAPSTDGPSDALRPPR
jgi:hypothetical protein